MSTQLKMVGDTHGIGCIVVQRDDMWCVQGVDGGTFEKSTPGPPWQPRSAQSIASGIGARFLRVLRCEHRSARVSLRGPPGCYGRGKRCALAVDSFVSSTHWSNQIAQCAPQSHLSLDPFGEVPHYFRSRLPSDFCHLGARDA